MLFTYSVGIIRLIYVSRIDITRIWSFWLNIDDIFGVKTTRVGNFISQILEKLSYLVVY